MTRIENNVTLGELNDRELDRVSGGSDLLKYAIADGAQKGVAEAGGGGTTTGFGSALGCILSGLCH
jgi:hypothetical protein